MERATYYKNVFDSEQLLFCPKKANGIFDCPNWLDRINPFSSKYIEGDAWHYRFNVPHNMTDLIYNLYAGKDNFVTLLTEFFERSKFFPLKAIRNPFYWAGNEEDLFAVWEFVYADRPDLT